MTLELNDKITIPDSELSWQFSASSGPGGQSVNTSNTRVQLSFDLANSRSLPDFLQERALTRLESKLVDGVLTVVASEHRSQSRNRTAAESRLADMLRQAIAPPPPRRQPTKKSKSSDQKRLDSKARRSATKSNRRRPGIE